MPSSIIWVRRTTPPLPSKQQPCLPLTTTRHRPCRPSPPGCGPPEDPPFEERHPVLALLNLLLRLPPVLLLILLWLLLLGLIRPLEWLHARARRQPLTAAPLSEALRSRFGDWILRLF